MQDNQVYQEPTTKSKKKILTMIIGFTLAIILFVLGVVIYFTYHATNESGKTIANLESELTSLNTEIDNLSKNESNVFSENGFSESYFTAANEIGQKKIKAMDLEDEIDTLKEKESQKSLVNTGALWFFIIGFVVIVITIILSILFRSDRDRAPQIAVH